MNNNLENGNRLYKDGDSTSPHFIAPATGSVTNPLPLAPNQWGYSVSSTTPTAGEVANYKFQSVPLSNNPNVIMSSEYGVPEISTLDVHYGARINFDLAAGSYSGNIKYSALSNGPVTEALTVTPSTITSPDTEIEINTPLHTLDSDLDEIKVYVGDTETAENICANPRALITDHTTNQIRVSCVAPAHAPGNTASILKVSTSEVDYAYDNDKNNGASIRCVARNGKTPTFNGIISMQSMTARICNAETTPYAFKDGDASNQIVSDTTKTTSSDRNLVPEATLTDSRDNKKYVIRKLADGNCWMVQNLAFSPSAGQEFSIADTYINSGRYFTAPGASAPGANWDINGKDGPHFVEPEAGYEYYRNGTTPSSTGKLTESAGNYYDWTMASAGARSLSGSTITSTTIGKAADSFCPKGWQLPRNTMSRSFDELLTAYGLPNSAAGTDTQSPFSFVRAGRYIPGSSWSDRGTQGYTWAGTLPYSLVNSGSTINLQKSSPRGYGLPIRCLAAP